MFSLPKVLDGASAESSLLNALGSPRIVREVQGTAVDRLKLRVGHAHLFDTTVPTLQKALLRFHVIETRLQDAGELVWIALALRIHSIAFYTFCPISKRLLFGVRFQCRSKLAVDTRPHMIEEQLAADHGP